MPFEEFLAWDGDGNPELRAEWVDGEIVPMVSIDLRHSLISNFAIALLSIACSHSQLGVLLSDAFVMRPSASGNGRSPDILLVRAEHMDRVARQFVNGPADIAIEIVSTGSIKTDYMVKAAEYRRAGVPEYWIIDPMQEQTTLLLLSQKGEYIEPELDENKLFHSLGLNGLAINAGWFNQDPLPDVLGILREWGMIEAA